MSNKPLPKITKEEAAKFEHDLHPARNAGINDGTVGPNPDGNRTAYEVKEVHTDLAEAFSDDELKQIPILPVGMQLDQNATYLDLGNRSRGEITGFGDMKAGEANYYVPKSMVGYPLYNRLRGITGTERTGMATGQESDEARTETMEERAERMQNASEFNQHNHEG